MSPFCNTLLSIFTKLVCVHFASILYRVRFGGLGRARSHKLRLMLKFSSEPTDNHTHMGSDRAIDPVWNARDSSRMSLVYSTPTCPCVYVIIWLSFRNVCVWNFLLTNFIIHLVRSPYASVLICWCIARPKWLLQIHYLKSSVFGFSVWPGVTNANTFHLFDQRTKLTPGYCTQLFG